MQFFELLFLIVSIFFLATISFLGNNRKLQIRCFQLGLMVFVIHLIFEIIRWQTSFSFLIFAISSLFMLKRSVSHLFFRFLGFVIGILFISTSAFYVLMMPIMKLPAPSGEYIVGSTNYSVTDLSRSEIKTEDPNDKRELFVEVWYPANLDGFEEAPPVKPLWEELYKGESDRVSFFMNYLKGIDTHSYPDIPPNSDHGTFPVILFNHALQMFTSQSTLLMEHLASHGYIVVSIAHPYESLRVNLQDAGTVIPEFISSKEKFVEGIEWIKKTSIPINEAIEEMKKTKNSLERAQIMLSAIKNSDMNSVVNYWVEDNKFVLDELLDKQQNQFIFHNIIDTSRIGVMGMSIGGAVATEVMKSDYRIKAAINVDGLQYGNMNLDSIKSPFMMLYSEDGKGVNEFLKMQSNSDFYEYTFINSRHADFTDMAIIWPFMRVYGQLGEINGERMSALTNKVVLNFWDIHLKEKSIEYFDPFNYPELENSEIK